MYDSKYIKKRFKMKFDVEKISKILKDKEATNTCNRCNRNEFTILRGYTILGLQDSTQGIVLGGANSIPVINVVCTHCGAITQHALGALGLLNNETGKDNGK